MTFKHLRSLVLFASCVFALNNSQAQTVSTFAGTALQGYGGNGVPATSASVMLHQPNQIAVDAAGNFYFADENNYVIRKISTSGIITTIAGTGNGATVPTPSGVPATSADLDFPSGVTVDASGNVYIGDAGQVRKVNTSGILTTIAGTPTQGYSGDGGPATAAQITSADHMSFDHSGNLYFADFSNNCIRKISSAGIITTVAGEGPDSAGYSGDGGQATNAKLYQPRDVTFDAAGNMYILDAFNSAVRKVNTSGVISTVAGKPSLGVGYSGDGGPATNAQLWWPNAIALDAAGNIYIAEPTNQVIRKVNTSGIISTFVGTNTAGWNGDGHTGSATQIDNPLGVVVFGNNLYFCDAGNTRIRKISTLPTGISNIDPGSNNCNLFPNPNNGSFTISGDINTTVGTVRIDVEDITGKILLADNIIINNGSYSKQLSFENKLSPGVYFVRVNITGNSSIMKFIVQ